MLDKQQSPPLHTYCVAFVRSGILLTQSQGADLFWVNSRAPSAMGALPSCPRAVKSRQLLDEGLLESSSSSNML